MGLLDKLKARGVVSAVKPAAGTAPADEQVVRERLLAIAGAGIQTTQDAASVTIAWAAKVAAAGPGSAAFEHRYRAIEVELDPAAGTAHGICLKRTTDAQLELRGSLSASGAWERGQFVGAETLDVLAWIGPHQAAAQRGYRFNWRDLRDPAIEAVTGAGWTYHPRR